MDLDFSFALVSSLTPRSHISRTPLSETNKLSSTKTQKSKQKPNIDTGDCNKASQQSIKGKGKENQSPKNQQMNKNVAFVNITDDKCFEDKCSDERTSSCFPIDMANIAVRKSKVRKSRRKNKSSPLQVDNRTLRGPCDDSSVVSSTEKFCCTVNKSGARDDALTDRLSVTSTNDIQNAPSISSIKDNFCSKVNKVERPERLNLEEIVVCTKNLKNSSVFKKGVKRKSPRFSELSGVSSDVVENSDVEPEETVNNISFSKNSIVTRQRKQSSLVRLSDFSETSLSPAYDSDSFKPARKRGVKVIPETPETDESFKIDLNSNEKRKINAKKNEKINSFNTSNRGSHGRNMYLDASENINLDSCLPQHKELLEGCDASPKFEENPKKKLRSSNESSLSDMFKLESSIKHLPTMTTVNNDKIDLRNIKKDKRKLSSSPILKDINIKSEGSKTKDPKKEKQSKFNKSLNKKETCEEEENNCKPSKTNIKGKNKKSSPILVSSPKSNLIPPTEVIPKFEHINNWLKDTQEKVLTHVGRDSSFDSPKERKKKPSGESRFLLSLSPRIKNKKKIAENTLQEEQKIFEELYGNDFGKRLSDEVDEVISIASSSESVQLSEKVLEKLYGTVWQKSAVLPQSEPKKGRKNTSLLKKKAPFTERKKQRTSIYDVFSSSSSEDRFEEFLESVQRGKLDPRRRNDRPGTPEFINDSDSDSNSSIGFYHNIVSSAVKEEAKSFRCKDTDSSTNRTKVNRRRLSFASSKDDCSESGRSDIQLADKRTTKSTKDNKKNNRKPRYKKKPDDFEEKIFSDINGFTLVTPLKVKDKKTDSGLGDRLKKTLESEVPKSVGKSKTPKQSNKTNSNNTSEEELRRKYLGGDGFKVPKNLSSLKTPTKQTSAKVPSSPALSFLSSLSEMTAGLPCHPDALAYKKDFKNKREELTKKLFTLYNKEVFEDKLPADMLIQWNARMTSTSGYCYNKRLYSNNQIFRSSRIVLSTKILDRADRLRDTLIHELCHAATWIVNATSDGHGPNWRAWADRANRRFPELPVIKRCHDYAIATKFTYKCMSCGYCIGRHSKSLDTDRKRCGFCYGKFQVFVTAKMSTASATSGSDSVTKPRNPTGFALFVKDNYAAVKKQHNVPHGQVMKLLSQKFAEVKINKQSTDNQVLSDRPS